MGVKDYRVTIKVRNNRILRAIEEAGGTPGLKWCEEHDLPYTGVNDLINMTVSPIGPDGAVKESAARLCARLGKLPEELWSNAQLYPLERNFSELDMDYGQVVAMLPAEQQSYLPDFSHLDREQARQMLESALASLPPRCRDVIGMRFYEDLTLDQIGDRLGVGKEQARQIEAQALRLLRHPKRGLGPARDLI